MRAVVQKVTSAAVEVDGAVISSIGQGLLCLVGLAKTDTERDAEAMAKRILKLRAFAAAAPTPAAASDASAEQRPWAASVTDIGGEVLLVSQFTLHARTRGRASARPDFSRAMPHLEAAECWKEFVDLVRREALAAGAKGVSDGAFGKMMHVRIHNDGPVTFLLDTDEPLGGGGGGTSASASAAASEGATTTAAAAGAEAEGDGKGHQQQEAAR